MQVVVPNMADWLKHYRDRPKTEYRLDSILRKDLLEGKLYVGEGSSENWHRHVQQHGPGPEAYALYNLAMCEFEESVCSK